MQKFHPYAERGVLVGYDQSSLAWYVRFTQEEVAKSEHVQLEKKKEIVEVVSEIGTGGQDDDINDNTGNKDDSMEETKEKIRYAGNKG